jgi:hypothetical protein
MSLRLGELLINEKLITPGQLEEALQAQVIFGGKLGTILIEMGAVNELDLARVLAKQMGVACLHPDQLINIPESVLNTLTPELAEKFLVLPVALDQRKLTVALTNPRDLKAIDELAFRTGYVIRPMLAPELRLTLALEKYYQVRRKVRYIAPPKMKTEVPAVFELGRTEKEISLETEADLSDLGTDAPAGITPLAVPPKAPEEPLDLGDAEIVEETAAPANKGEAATLEALTRRLVAAGDRNDVAEALIHYLGAHYARAALFTVIGGQVSGWRAVRNGTPIPGFEDFQLPLSEPSALKTAAESQSYLIGPITPSGANLALLTLLGKPTPATALFLPLAMLGRVVALLYLDDPEVDPADALVDAQQLAGKTLLAFELLILKSKILRL